MKKDYSNLPILSSKPVSEKEEKFLREESEYEFYNLEQPGLAISFVYGGSKNKQKFTFFHGGKYRLPRFIAKHVESSGTPIYKWRPNGLGSLEKKLEGRKPRFRMSQVY